MIRIGSLFSGIGGIDLSFLLSGCKVIWANEKDFYASKTYKYNFSESTLVECDINKIDANDIPDIDILTAGFPCQPFSIMGYQRGFKDPRGNLFFEIARITEIKMPKVIFLENVENLINHDSGKTFYVICNTLKQLGYALKFKIMNSKDYANIPQDRSRIFIIAFLNHSACDKFLFPEPIDLKIKINDIINRLEKHNEVYYYKKESCYYEELQMKVIDINAIYRIDDSGVANRKYSICPTLKANMGTFHDRVPVIKDNFGVRKLTPMECLKLQGFPEKYKFPPIPLNEAYKQAGNTVCVPLVKRIAENILKVI